MAILEVNNLRKRFDRTEVLQGIDFSLNKGRALVIIGSSGSGKTTLLRCLNFLERPDAGVIRVGGETLFDAADPATQREADIRKKRLHFGLVFQSFHLFPQYTALKNITLAPELLAREKPEFKAKRTAMLADIRATPSNCWSGSAWPTSGIFTPTSSPAGSSSAWPSPGRWRCSRTSCALTSPPAPWTRS